MGRQRLSKRKARPTAAAPGATSDERAVGDVRELLKEVAAEAQASAKKPTSGGKKAASKGGRGGDEDAAGAAAAATTKRKRVVVKKKSKQLQGAAIPAAVAAVDSPGPVPGADMPLGDDAKPRLFLECGPGGPQAPLDIDAIIKTCEADANTKLQADPLCSDLESYTLHGASVPAPAASAHHLEAAARTAHEAAPAAVDHLAKAILAAESIDGDDDVDMVEGDDDDDGDGGHGAGAAAAGGELGDDSDEATSSEADDGDAQPQAKRRRVDGNNTNATATASRGAVRATLDDDSDDEAEEEAPAPAAAAADTSNRAAKRAPGAPARAAGLDSSSDEGSSSAFEEADNDADDAADAAVPNAGGDDDDDDDDDDLLANVPLSRFVLPPEPSRQPHLAVATLLAGDEMRLRGVNVRVKVLYGALGVAGAVIPTHQWVTVWAAELEYAVQLTPAEETGVPDEAHDENDACREHPLLSRVPDPAEYEWAIRRAAKISTAHGGVVADGRACIILLAAANRAPLLEYAHSFHPTPRPQVLGPILDRLAHCSAGKSVAHVMRTPDGFEECLAHVKAARAPRVAIVGGADTGKSTLSLLLVNHLLAAGRRRVAYIDTDLGQSEFTAPGSVSLTVIAAPLVGPSYTHQTTPLASVFVGATTCQTDPFLWCRSVVDMLRVYANDASLRDCPLVVNTHGWTHGLGLRCLSELLQRVAPTVIAVTGGVGSGRGDAATADGAEDTQASRVARLMKYEAGLSATFATHYGIRDRTVFGSEEALCGPHLFTENIPKILDVRPPGRTWKSTSKGWWVRQVLLTMSVAGPLFNDYLAQARPDAQGHALLRGFFGATCPYVVPLNTVKLHIHSTEWEDCLPDACPKAAVLSKMERSIVALYSSGAPATASSGNGVTIAAAPPPPTAAFVGYAMVAAAAAAPAAAGGVPLLYLITPADPLRLAGVDYIVGGMEAPAVWYRDAAEAPKAKGRAVLQDRKGGAQQQVKR